MTEKYAMFSRNYIDGVGIGVAKKHTSPIPKTIASKLASKYSKIWNRGTGKGYHIKVFVKKVSK